MRDSERAGRPAHDDSTPSFVRPFTLTRGRTVPRVELPFEATLTVEPSALRHIWPDGPQGRAVAVADGRSVAEVAAALRLPIGVARVILGDLVADGHVTVQRTLANADVEERRDLLQRTLRGLLVS